MSDPTPAAEPERLLAVIEEKFSAALEMAHKAASGEVRGYSNPFNTGSHWIEHAHQLLKMRARILGETVPEPALEHIEKLEAELADARSDISGMFREAMAVLKETTNSAATPAAAERQEA